MANNTPFSGLTDAAGGLLLPVEQGEILTNGVLQSAAALSMAGDARTTRTRKETFAIWGGTPVAEFVGEGGTKPVTGGEFSPGTLNVKKVAVITTFTDEMIEDVQSGDLNVLVDGGIRDAISDKIDADAIDGSNFDSQYADTTSSVAMGTSPDALAVAVSAAMGSLEANGYGSNIGVIVGGDYQRHLRDARVLPGGGTAGTVLSSQGLYQGFNDPLYGQPYGVSTNVDGLSAGGTVAFVFHRPNVHVRVRQDVTVSRSNEATVGGTSLWQNDLTGVRYVTRVGLWIHDINRAVIKITK